MESLRRSTGSSRGGDESRKFRVPCKERLSEVNPTTKDWLEIVGIIHKENGIMKGIFEKHKDVVVKSGSPGTLQRDYQFGETLFDLGIPNTVKYYCFFVCPVGGMPRSTGPLCDIGAGQQTGFIVMPHYAMGSLESYAWNEENFDVLKAVLKQTCAALLMSFERCGFCHRDLHPANILLRKTKKARVSYAHGLEVETNGVYPMIIDYETAALSACPSDIYMDIRRIVVNSCNYTKYSDLALTVDIAPITRLIEESRPVTRETYQLVFDMIDTLKILFVRSRLPAIDFTSSRWRDVKT